MTWDSNCGKSSLALPRTFGSWEKSSCENPLWEKADMAPGNFIFNYMEGKFFDWLQANLAATIHPRFRFGWADSEIVRWLGWNHHSEKIHWIVQDGLKNITWRIRSKISNSGKMNSLPRGPCWDWLKNPVWSCDMFMNIDDGMGKLDKVCDKDESSKPMTFNGSCL